MFLEDMDFAFARRHNRRLRDKIAAALFLQQQAVFVEYKEISFLAHNNILANRARFIPSDGGVKFAIIYIMSNVQIDIKDISLFFPDKMCFEDFSAQITPGERIGIIGRNGSGKSTLLKILQGAAAPSYGDVNRNAGVSFAYVPQIFGTNEPLSGAQKFHKALTAALAQNPDVLLLDEPTNHLDARNRNSLMQMLKHFYGTLLVVSHDVELLTSSVDVLWHIHDGQISVFSGRYADYFEELRKERETLERELDVLKKEKKQAHKDLMKEQSRAKKSRIQGEKAVEQGKWAPIIAGGQKRRAELTAGSKKKELRGLREGINERIKGIYKPEIIKPKFSITSDDVAPGTIAAVTGGGVSYGDKLVLGNINLSVQGAERVALTGDNASGKTTILKAVLDDPSVIKTGFWTLPPRRAIGFLEQNYLMEDTSKTVLETLRCALPSYTHAELRDFLNDFLFRKEGEVNAAVSVLSGGERARLALALIAAQSPKLLLLDEPTNNVDLETRGHIIQVLREYPGAVIAVSHDRFFLEEIGINTYYNASGFK